MHRILSISLFAASFYGGIVWAYEEMTVAEGGMVQMVDHPYTRFAATDEVQSQIVPTLIRQER